MRHGTHHQDLQQWVEHEHARAEKEALKVLDDPLFEDEDEIDVSPTSTLTTNSSTSSTGTVSTDELPPMTFKAGQREDSDNSDFSSEDGHGRLHEKPLPPPPLSRSPSLTASRQPSVVSFVGYGYHLPTPTTGSIPGSPLVGQAPSLSLLDDEVSVPSILSPSIGQSGPVSPRLPSSPSAVRRYASAGNLISAQRVSGTSQGLGHQHSLSHPFPTCSSPGSASGSRSASVSGSTAPTPTVSTSVCTPATPLSARSRSRAGSTVLGAHEGVRNAVYIETLDSKEVEKRLLKCLNPTFTSADEPAGERPEDSGRQSRWSPASSMVDLRFVPANPTDGEDDVNFSWGIPKQFKDALRAPPPTPSTPAMLPPPQPSRGGTPNQLVTYVQEKTPEATPSTPKKEKKRKSLLLSVTGKRKSSLTTATATAISLPPLPSSPASPTMPMTPPIDAVAPAPPAQDGEKRIGKRQRLASFIARMANPNSNNHSSPVLPDMASATSSGLPTPSTSLSPSPIPPPSPSTPSSPKQAAKPKTSAHRPAPLKLAPAGSPLSGMSVTGSVSSPALVWPGQGEGIEQELLQTLPPTPASMSASASASTAALTSSSRSASNARGTGEVSLYYDDADDGNGTETETETETEEHSLYEDEDEMDPHLLALAAGFDVPFSSKTPRGSYARMYGFREPLSKKTMHGLEFGHTTQSWTHLPSVPRGCTPEVPSCMSPRASSDVHAVQAEAPLVPQRKTSSSSNARLVDAEKDAEARLMTKEMREWEEWKPRGTQSLIGPGDVQPRTPRAIRDPGTPMTPSTPRASVRGPTASVTAPLPQFQPPSSLPALKAIPSESSFVSSPLSPHMSESPGSGKKGARGRMSVVTGFVARFGLGGGSGNDGQSQALNVFAGTAAMNNRNNKNASMPLALERVKSIGSVRSDSSSFVSPGAVTELGSSDLTSPLPPPPPISSFVHGRGRQRSGTTSTTWTATSISTTGTGTTSGSASASTSPTSPTGADWPSSPKLKYRGSTKSKKGKSYGLNLGSGMPQMPELMPVMNMKGKGKKKLIVSGVGVDDVGAYQAVKGWCEAFGAVRQITRKDNGNLVVDWKSRSVADTVCRVQATVNIKGAGSVALSWVQS